MQEYRVIPDVEIISISIKTLLVDAGRGVQQIPLDVVNKDTLKGISLGDVIDLEVTQEFFEKEF